MLHVCVYACMHSYTAWVLIKLIFTAWIPTNSPHAHAYMDVLVRLVQNAHLFCMIMQLY